MKALTFALLTVFAAHAFAQDGPIEPRRAVLINGFRLSESSWQSGTQKSMEGLAQMLKRRGFAVSQFSAPVRSYPEIREALNGAEVVVYWGHGVIMDRGGCFNPTSANVGGFSIDGKHITPDGIRREVRLAPNAIVILPNSCYAAGNASMDGGKVRREVLEARMVNYARPFLDIGARAVASCLNASALLNGILDGKPISEVYERASFGGKTVRQQTSGTTFLYRERPEGNGISTSGALFWRGPN